MESGDLILWPMRQTEQLQKLCRPSMRLAEHPAFLFGLSVELVRDRATKEPAPEETLKIFEETRRNGLVASRSGPYRNVIRMYSPLCLSMADVDDVMDRFIRTFKTVGR